MEDRRKANRKKGDKQIRNAKFIVGCTLIGTVIAGAFFGWVPTNFDIRIVGGGLGMLAGLMAGQFA